MLIGISGAHSTGKTTLVDALKEDLTDWVVCKNMTRNAKQIGYKINKDGDDYTQAWLADQHALRVREYHSDNSHYLLDRTIIDCLAYTVVGYLRGDVSANAFDYVEDVTDSLINEYDEIFYIEPELTLVSDGTRSTDILWWAEVIGMFEHVMCRYSVSPIRISGSVDERKRRILDEVSKSTSV